MLKKNIKMLISIVCVIAVMFGVLFTVGTGIGVKAISADGNIGVLLTTMGDLTSIDITVSGVYSLQDITDEAYAHRNNTRLRERLYNFKVQNGNIVVTSDEGSFVLSNRVTLYAHTPARTNYLSMYNPSYGSVKYLGNLELAVNPSGKFVFVNTLNLDDYLCGVVPYEMSNGQATESLKVQAVCARSYAYRMSAKTTAELTYHLVDTTQNQVYRGFNPSHNNAIKAVDQTSGQILTYNGNVITTYYSSSNGGITEATKNAWVSNLPYFTVQVDPYDRAYQDKKYTMSKTSVYSGNVTLIRDSLTAELADVYDMSTLNVKSIDSIDLIYFSTPAELKETERRVQSMSIKFTFTIKNNKTGNTETLTRSITKSKESVRTTWHMYNTSTSKPAKIPSTKFYITETATEFIFTVDGNGHGIGMSQNGTYARVAAGQKYDEILAFYFTGTKLSKLNYKAYVYKEIPENEFIDTQMPSLADIESPYGVQLTESVALYKEAGQLFDIVRYGEAGEVFVVTGQTDDWFRVVDSSDAIYYVRKQYVELTKQEIINRLPKMTIGNVIEDTSFYSDPENAESVTDAVSSGKEVLVMDVVGDFYYVFYNGAKKYIPISAVELTSQEIYAVYNAQVTAYKASLYESADVSSEKNGFVSQNSDIVIFNIANGFAECLINGEISYIEIDKLHIDPDSLNYIEHHEDGSQSINVQMTVITNVYRSDDETGEILDELLENDIVTVVMEQDGWYKIIYAEGYAFIKKDGTVIYSENIDYKYAVATADKYLYSSPDLKNVAGMLETNGTAQIVEINSNVVTFRLNGELLYANLSDIIIKTENVTVTE